VIAHFFAFSLCEFAERADGGWTSIQLFRYRRNSGPRSRQHSKTPPRSFRLKAQAVIGTKSFIGYGSPKARFLLHAVFIPGYWDLKLNSPGPDHRLGTADLARYLGHAEAGSR
jgi:hypothetical protein